MTRGTPTPEDEERTGDCYALAWRYIIDNREDYPLYLVHGRPVLQREPYCEYGHAWVEYDDPNSGDRMVIDPQAGSYDEPVIMPAMLYYSVGRVEWEQCIVYDRTEAMAAALRTEHFGPWEGPDTHDFKPKQRHERMRVIDPVDPERRLHEILANSRGKEL